MKAKFLTLIFVGLVTAAFAQYGGGGHFTVDYFIFNKVPKMTVNITGVNNTLPKTGVMLGGGGYGVINGVVIGGRGNGSVGLSISMTDLEAAYSFGGGQFDIGYTILNRKKLFSFVFLGLGGYGYGVEINNTGDKEVDLGTVVIPPDSKVNFEYGSFTLNPGVSMNFKLNGWCLGMDISYLYATDNSFSSLMFGINIGGIGISQTKEKD